MRARLVSIAGVVLGLLASPEIAAQTTPTPKAAAPAAKASSAAASSPGNATGSKPGKAKEPDPLPPAEARVWVIAPSLGAPWTLRIDNTGAKPVRIPADVRLLQMEAELPEKADPLEAADADPKKKAAVKKKPAAKPKPLVCSLPDAMKPGGFPEARALLLAPGESYIERFDPQLFCFGKSGAGLVGSATLRGAFGWKPPKKTFAMSKKPPSGPFAVEGTEYPPTVAPQYQIDAPTIRLSYKLEVNNVAAMAPGAGDKAGAGEGPDRDHSNGSPGNPKKINTPEASPAKSDAGAKTPAEAGGPKPAAQDPALSAPKKEDEAKRPAPIVDENAPRLVITVGRYQEAAAERNVSITVTAKNEGHRPMLAALRPRMLSFEVVKPDGEKAECGANTLPRGMPREAFRTYKPGETTSFTVLLSEICPRRTFARPGLYSVTPTLHAEETGESLGLVAYTAVAEAVIPALVRVQAGPEPFYSQEPRAVPTPRQVVLEDEAGAPAGEGAAGSGDASSPKETSRAP